MTLSGIVSILYVIDIQYYKLHGDLGGVIGKSCSICNKELYFQEKHTSNICMDHRFLNYTY